MADLCFLQDFWGITIKLNIYTRSGIQKIMKYHNLLHTCSQKIVDYLIVHDIILDIPDRLVYLPKASSLLSASSLKCYWTFLDRHVIIYFSSRKYLLWIICDWMYCDCIHEFLIHVCILFLSEFFLQFNKEKEMLILILTCKWNQLWTTVALDPK